MAKPRRKICVITGSRAEYGLLRLTISRIKATPALELQLLVTGVHLSPEFGSTINEIKADGFNDFQCAPVVPVGDDQLAMAKAIGVGVGSIAEKLCEMKPDVVLVLGDRFEILAATIAAYTLRIPVAHIHGGEVTGGALDEGYRHAITKMASLHFVAASDYRRRVIQMGEHPKSVFLVGAPGLESIRAATFHDLKVLSEKIGLKLEAQKYIVVAYHPETLLESNGTDAASSLLGALDEFCESYKILISGSNADAGGASLNSLFNAYAQARKGRVSIFTSLGHLGFISLLKQSALLVGNSSSGIIEAPALGIPTVNIGGRQKGRLFGSSISTVDGTKEEIAKAVKSALQPDNSRFAHKPYGDGGGVSENIVNVLADEANFSRRDKIFYDLEVTGGE